MPISVFTSVKELTSVTTVRGVTIGTSITAQGLGGSLGLALNFLSSTSLDTRITFSRGTNATLINSTGKLTFAPSNMFLNSESFTVTTSGWAKVLSTITSNVIAAPDGTFTADKLVSDSTATAVHSVTQTISAQNAVNYAFSVYVKAAELTQIALTYSGTAFGTIQAVFDISTVSVVATTGTPLWTNISLVGDGWYRVGVGATATSTATANMQIRLAKANSPTFTGNGVDGLYIWGAQFGAITYETAPRGYTGTTVKNLLARTEEFDTGGWAKTGSSVAPQAAINPNGIPNADKIIEDTALSGHLVSQTNAYIIGTRYTLSVYAKAAERRYMQMIWTTASFGSTLVGAFDLVNGVTAVGAGSITSSITAVGDGWYRCSITATATASASSGLQIRISSALTTGAGNSYQGDGTSGIYLWGAQLSDSGTVDPYVYNGGSAVIASAAYYGPRFDYNPVTLAPLGLLIEEARTNLLLNSATLSTQIVTTTAQSYTLSFYGTGTIVFAGTATGTLTGTGVFPNRVSLTFTATAGALTLTVTGTVSNAQLEAGGFATSYIPTAAATVTRSADIVTMANNNFTNWFNPGSGTFILSAETSPNGFATYMSASNGSIIQNSIHLDNDTGIQRAVYYSGSAEQAALGLDSIGTIGASTKIGTAYAVSNLVASRNNGSSATSNTGALPVGLTQLNIGGDDRGAAGNYVSAHIQSLSYYNTRLSDSVLKTLTV